MKKRDRRKARRKQETRRIGKEKRSKRGKGGNGVTIRIGVWHVSLLINATKTRKHKLLLFHPQV